MEDRVRIPVGYSKNLSRKAASSKEAKVYASVG
jgi:hypothetical protein